MKLRRMMTTAVLAASLGGLCSVTLTLDAQKVVMEVAEEAATD